MNLPAAFSLGKSVDLSIDQTPGVVLVSAGAFLAGEGVISILFSQDQQGISTFGRLARIGVGLSLIGWVASKS